LSEILPSLTEVKVDPDSETNKKELRDWLTEDDKGKVNVVFL